MHPNVRYLRPVILANYPDVAGRTMIDFVSVETVVPTSSIEEKAVSNPVVQNGTTEILTGTFQTIATITNTSDFDAMFAPTLISTQGVIVVERNASDYTVIGEVFLRIRHQKRNGSTWTTLKTDSWVHGYQNFGPQNRSLTVPTSYTTQFAGVADTTADGERFLFEASHGQQKAYAGFTQQAGQTATVILTDTILSTIDFKR